MLSLSRVVLHLAALVHVAPAPVQISTDGSKSALYGAAAAVIVALIGAISTVLAGRARGNGRRTSSLLHRYEKWFLLNSIDSRRIRTGYESLSEVHLDREPDGPRPGPRPGH